MPEYTRHDLRRQFQGGYVQNAIHNLIDSTLNISEDGMSISQDYGLALTPKGSSKKLISFFENINNRANPLWGIGLTSTDKKVAGLNILEGETSRLFIQNGGKIGVNNENPRCTFDVNGLIATKGIIGSYASGLVDADGKWHAVPGLRNLKGCQALEVFAHINDIDETGGRFALTYAILLMSNGHKGGQITKIRTSVEAASRWLWGRFFNKIKFRWQLEENTDVEERYRVEIRTRTHYGMKNGEPKKIFYRVRKMWDKEFENRKISDTTWMTKEPPKTQIRSRMPQFATPSTGQQTGKRKLTIKKKN